MKSSSKLMNCLHCNKEVLVPPYRFDTFKYCSRSCGALAVRIASKSTCLICGNEFEHISSRATKAKYCSRSCYYKAMKQKGKTIYICKHCGKDFRAPKSTNRIYCSKDCVGKASKELWNPNASSIRRTMNRKGMLHQCERCGYSTEPSILGVHHKDRNRKNNKQSNLEVLCPNCHSLEHMKHIPHGFKE